MSVHHLLSPGCYLRSQRRADCRQQHLYPNKGYQIGLCSGCALELRWAYAALLNQMLVATARTAHSITMHTWFSPTLIVMLAVKHMLQSEVE